MPGTREEFLTKSASPLPMTDDMDTFWNQYPKKMPDKFLYFRVNILGAGEYWGSNLNGDYFPEVALKKYHKTFHHARLFTHHQNKDPNKALGRVIYSSYNDAPYAKRVEVIVAADRSNPKADDIIRKIENGERIEVSMGCRVPFDRCSVCNNRASTRAKYCSHLKNDMNKLMPDGTRVMAYNDDPAFFDVSVVTIPADPSSGAMEKIAALSKISSAELGEILGLRSKYAESEEEKESTIEKTGPDDKEEPKKIEPPVDIDDKKCELRELGAGVAKSDTDIPESMLERISDFPLPQILATLGALKIPIKPKEYTCIVVRKMVSPPVSIKITRMGGTFAPAPPSSHCPFNMMSDFSPKLAHIVRPLMEKRSMYPHYVHGRKDNESHEKVASSLRIDYPEAASLYAAYVRDITNMDQTKVAAVLSAYPEFAERVTGLLDDAIFGKTASTHDIVRDSYIGQELLIGAYEA